MDSRRGCKATVSSEDSPNQAKPLCRAVKGRNSFLKLNSWNYFSYHLPLITLCQQIISVLKHWFYYLGRVVFESYGSINSGYPPFLCNLALNNSKNLLTGFVFLLRVKFTFMSPIIVCFKIVYRFSLSDKAVMIPLRKILVCDCQMIQISCLLIGFPISRMPGNKQVIKKSYDLHVSTWSLTCYLCGYMAYYNGDNHLRLIWQLTDTVKYCWHLNF